MPRYMRGIFVNSLFLRVRLFQKIVFPIVIACLLAVAVKSSAHLQKAERTPALFKKEWCYKAIGTQLNRDGLRHIPVRYSPGGRYSSGHATTGKVLQWAFLPGTGYGHIYGPATYTTAYTGIVHSFVPLLRLLLFPKHWFW
jgi:hypothetical protein